ncbi:hypothetical protein XELAEV_180012362mg, partial [Xenopus laevis]
MAEAELQRERLQAIA